jgi:hypothetical protein
LAPSGLAINGDATEDGPELREGQRDGTLPESPPRKPPTRPGDPLN